MRINSTDTKTMLVVSDESGEIGVVHFIDEYYRQKEALTEGSQVRIIGKVR